MWEMKHKLLKPTTMGAEILGTTLGGYFESVKS
jgi:putative N-acetylmannosamine-6-phosphate epimerase